jgi:hypothetical protein
MDMKLAGCDVTEVPSLVLFTALGGLMATSGDDGDDIEC